MKKLSSAVCVALALTVPCRAQVPAEIPPKDAEKLRSLLTNGLSPHFKSGVTKLLAQGKRMGRSFDGAALIALLREGPLFESRMPEPRKVHRRVEKIHEYDDRHLGYRFRGVEYVHDYAVDVPASYRRDRPTPVLIDLGHGPALDSIGREELDHLAWMRAQADEAGLPGWLVVTTSMLQSKRMAEGDGPPPEVLLGDFRLLLADLASRFHLDTDRIYLLGYEDSGFWAWYAGRAGAGRIAGMALLSADPTPASGYLENFAGTALYVAHTDSDTVVPFQRVEEVCEELKGLGCELELLEVPGEPVTALPGSLHLALAWLAERKRERYPRQFSKLLQTLSDPWAPWVRIDKLHKKGDGELETWPLADVEAWVEGQRVTIRSEGVKQLTLGLSSELLDLDQPIEVVWNDEAVHEGVVKRDFVTTLELACERTDWLRTYECALELKEP